MTRATTAATTDAPRVQLRLLPRLRRRGARPMSPLITHPARCSTGGRARGITATGAATAAAGTGAITAAGTAATAAIITAKATRRHAACPFLFSGTERRHGTGAACDRTRRERRVVFALVAGCPPLSFPAEETWNSREQHARRGGRRRPDAKGRLANACGEGRDRRGPHGRESRRDGPGDRGEHPRDKATARLPPQAVRAGRPCRRPSGTGGTALHPGGIVPIVAGGVIRRRAWRGSPRRPCAAGCSVSCSFLIFVWKFSICVSCSSNFFR